MEAKRQLQNRPEEAAAHLRHKQAKRKLERFKRVARHRYIKAISKEADEAVECHDLGALYSVLKEVGIHMQDKSKVGMVPFDLDVAVDFVKSVGGEPGEVADGVADRTPQLPMCDALGDTPD
eukprot:6435953-Heterocapsa_arctica.AAC.1